MHQNYYFLRQVSKALEPRISGSVISECFSQSKDELIIRFERGTESFFIRANLSPSFTCLSFTPSFGRARKNSVDLFPEIVGRLVIGVRQFENERSFAILLSDSFTLLFKMHGNRSNVVIFEGDDASGLFRNNLVSDKNIRLAELDRVIDWSREAFLNNIEKPQSLYFTFGKVVWYYLGEHGFNELSPDEQWKKIQDVLRLLETPRYYVTFIRERPTLSLLDAGEVKAVIDEPLRASTEFFRLYTQDYALAREKNRLAGILRGRLESADSYCRKNNQRLDEVLQDNHYREWADLLMANLHNISPGTESAVIENFYDNQRPVEIPLKKDSTPQKTAEVYYRKAKNQHIEIERLEQSIKAKEEEAERLRQFLIKVETAEDFKSLKVLEAEIAPPEERSQEPLPYHEFEFRGFRIWVGRNATANDVLTLRHGYKDDLWLHAKDVSGSHVLIKHQAGKNFPKDVIEYAASLAAYNSRRRTESLCPVIVTPRKFVRKRKGDPPGAVVVDKEDVILVEPKKS